MASKHGKLTNLTNFFGHWHSGFGLISIGLLSELDKYKIRNNEKKTASTNEKHN